MSNSRPAIVVVAVTALAIATVVGTLFGVRHVALAPGLRGCALLVDRSAMQKCVAGRVATMIHDTSINHAMAALQQEVRTRRSLFDVCHTSMHVAARRVKIDIRAALDATKTAPAGCATNGFIHGLVERAVASGDARAIDAVVAACRATRSMENWTDNCVHGIGHGFRRRSSMKSSVASCEHVRDTSRSEIVACLTGAFMEDQFRNAKVKGHRDFITPCDDFATGDETQSCYVYLPARAGRILQLPMPRIGEACSQLPSTQDQESCLYGIGFVIAPDRSGSCVPLHGARAYVFCTAGFFDSQVEYERGASSRQNPKAGIDIPRRMCPKEPADRRDLCGAAAGIYSRYISGTVGVTSTALCEQWFDAGAQLKRCLGYATYQDPKSIFFGTYPGTG